MKKLFAFLKVLALLTVMISVTPEVTGQAQTNSGLVAYYQFIDPGSDNVNDSSGNGNTGQIIGSDWQYMPDRFNNAKSSLFLNLTDPSSTNAGTYVAVPRSAALDFNQDFTLSVWVNIPSNLASYHVHNLVSDGLDTNSANFRIISAADTNGNDYLQFVGNHDTGDIHIYLAPLRNRWWQAAVVRSGNSVSLFQNGTLVTNAPMTATLNNLPEIWLGGYPLTNNEAPSVGEYPLDGGIDDIRMYSRALSATEIQELYLSESQPLVNLVRAVKPAFSNLIIGSNYQLQVSVDLNTWTNQGSPFPATNSTMPYSQYFDVTNWDEFYFRLQSSP